MRTSTKVVVAVVALAVVGAGAWLIYQSMEQPTILVGASMQKPMEKCAEAFQKKTGIKMKVSYGDSGDVLSQVKQSGKGEMAILHEPYVTQMSKEGFASETHILAYMTPVIVVKKGNPKGVTGIKSLVALKSRVGLTLAAETPSGRIVQQALKNAGIQKEVMDNRPYENKSSGDLVGKMTMPDPPLDAVCVWNAVAAGKPNAVEIVRIEPEFMPKEFTEAPKDGGLTFYNGQVPVGVIVLKTGKFPDQTRKFVEFLQSEEGRAIWKECGYDLPAALASQPTSAK